MKLKWSHIIGTVLGGGIAASLSSLDYWENITPYLMTALSVMGAGVLVRLARGIPFSGADKLNLQEVRRISSAIKASIKALRTLALTIIVAMLTLIAAPGIKINLANILNKFEAAVQYIPHTEVAIVGIIGCLLTYIILRLISVVNGDVGLVEMQTEYLEQTVTHNQAQAIQDELNADEAKPFKNPENYGKIVQH